jgi:hypothetical protein
MIMTLMARPAKPQRMASCHPDRPLYAHDQCKSCYMKNLRAKSSTKVAPIILCGHSDRKHYAKGMCKPCYETEAKRAGKRDMTSVREYTDKWNKTEHGKEWKRNYQRDRYHEKKLEAERSDSTNQN